MSVRATCQYDLVGSGLGASAPFASLVFGSQKCVAQISRDSRDANGVCTYTVIAEAPPFLSTGCPSLNNVPITLVLESGNGGELARVANIGMFSYQEGGSTLGATVPDDSSPPGLASPRTRSPAHRASPRHQASHGRRKSDNSLTHHGLADVFGPSATAANATAQIQAQSHPHTDFSAAAATTGAYSQGSNSMLSSSYRGPSFEDHYSRNSSMLRSPQGTGWMFNNQLDHSLRASSSTLVNGTPVSLSRSSLTPLHHPPTTTPQLIRTSTLTQPAGGYPGYGVYQEKATLKLIGDLSSMAEGWTKEEWENKRRLVLFRKQQTGSVLTVSFKPVSPAERPPHSICISCIWWEEKQACYVTSVDTIHLLEQLLAAPNRFGVDEKNRIRRNLEGFRPATVSKSRPESEEFFKVIMGFGNPKPRNIEKDVKVFHWKDLASALYKIISKYSASTATVVTPTTSSHAATSMGLSGSYPALPPTPVSVTSSTANDASAAASYSGGGGHHHADSLASPRTLAGGHSSWAPTYGGAGKTMSPAAKTSSPGGGPNLRLSNTLPGVYDHRGSTHSLSSPYGLPGPSSHHSQSTPTHHQGQGAGYSHSSGATVSQTHSRNSWDGYSVADGYPSQAASGQAHGSVYGSGGYGAGAPRA